MSADDPLKERFEILRKRANQAANTATQREKEGLSRRFAQIGQVGSGAQIRAEAQTAERGAKRLAQAEETVGLAELGERQRLQEVKEARKFSTDERLGSQGFAAEQAGLGRKFATGERLGSQNFAAEQAGIGRDFASGQADIQRKFSTGERLSSQDFASSEAKIGRKFSSDERAEAQDFASSQADLSRSFTGEQNEFLRTLQQQAVDLQKESFDEGIRQFDETFARDSVTIDFNKRMSKDSANKGLLDDLGLGNFNSQVSFGGNPLSDPRLGSTKNAQDFVTSRF